MYYVDMVCALQYNCIPPIHRTDPKGHYVAMLMMFLINQIEKQSMTVNGMYYERYSKRRLSPNS